MENIDLKKLQAKKICNLEEEIRTLRSRLVEKNRLEEQLYQAQKMEALANLAGGVAHDFNNILQTVMGYTQLAIMKGNRSDPNHEDLKQIEIIARKGSELTKQLLAFGRKIPSESTPLDLNSKVKEIKGLLLRTIPRMIDIDLCLADKLGMVNIDESQMEQILMNLSLNARDSMREGGKLIFKTDNVMLKNAPVPGCFKAGSGKYVLLSVSDTGCGMSPNTMKNAFEPFFTTKGKEKGTGLGLSMVYSIVKNHGGFIDCSSQVGEGTTFDIYFPACTNLMEKLELSQTRKQERITGGNESILLVDDETDILKIVQDMLHAHGYKVMTAKSGEEAIYEYSRSTANLVILDVGMPGMGGIKCLQGLLSLDKNAKVLISTGYFPNRHLNKVLKLGAKGLLAKPYSLSELLESVRAVLDCKQTSNTLGRLTNEN